MELQRTVRAHCRQWGFDWGAAWSSPLLLLVLVNPRVGPANHTTLNHNLRKSGGSAFSSTYFLTIITNNVVDLLSFDTLGVFCWFCIFTQYSNSRNSKALRVMCKMMSRRKTAFDKVNSYFMPSCKDLILYSKLLISVNVKCAEEEDGSQGVGIHPRVSAYVSSSCEVVGRLTS